MNISTNNRKHKVTRIKGRSTGLGYEYRGVHLRRYPETRSGYWGAWRTTSFVPGHPSGDIRAGSMERLLDDIDNYLVQHEAQLLAHNAEKARWDAKVAGHNAAVDSVIGRQLHGVWDGEYLVRTYTDEQSARLYMQCVPHLNYIYAPLIWSVMKGTAA